MIHEKIFNYTFMLKPDSMTNIQNMFHYLCKKNEPEMLSAWLKKTSNYFADGT
jgi:hypothetical protein